MKKNAIVNRLANLLAGRHNSDKQKLQRSSVLRIEQLEERQLLSVSDVRGVDGGIDEVAGIELDQNAVIEFTLEDDATATPASLANAYYTVEPTTDPNLVLSFASLDSNTAETSPIKVTLELPEEGLARNEEATIKITYKNESASDVPAPLLVVQIKGDDGQEGALLTLDKSVWESDYQTTAQPAGFSTRLSFLGNGETAGTLKAGESVTKEIYWGGWLANVAATENYNVGVGKITADNTEALDLETWKSEMKSDALSDESWNGIWSRFTAFTGTTWGEYVAALGKLSGYLQSVGSDVCDSDALLAVIMSKASDAYNPIGATASSIDAVAGDSAFNLSLSRSRQDATIFFRDFQSVLGYGWDWNYDIGLLIDSDGNVTIAGSFGQTRSFQPAALPSNEMTYNAVDPLDLGVLKRDAKRAFTLTEQDGSVYKFTPDGLLSSYTDPNGNTVTATQASGRLVKLETATGASLSIEYNQFGRIAKVTDNYGDESVYKYDAKGEYLENVSWADGRSISYTYDKTLRVLNKIDYCDGTAKTYSYDADGFLTGVEVDGVSVSYVFGTTPETMLVYDTIENGVKTATTWLNENGAPVKYVDAEGRSVVFNYDANGLVTSVNNGDADTKVLYDANGNIIEMVDGNGLSTKFSYDANGRLEKLTDPSGVDTTFSYDAKGNVTRQARVDGTAEQWSYNADGSVKTYTARDGSSIAFEYNDKGNVVSAKYSTEANAVTYEYDARDNLSKIVEANGDETTFAYDSNDRLVKVSYADGRYLEYGYDSIGRQISISTGEDYNVKYTYDANGYLDLVLDGTKNDKVLTDYDYDALGRLAKETRGNGTYTVYGYDSTSLLTSKITYSPENVPVASFVYAYDATGQVTTMTTLDGTWSYGYDKMGQVTSAVFVSVSGGHIADQSYAYEYDANGNRIAETVDGARYEYVYDNMNRLLSDGRNEYTYDANGNMATKTILATGEVWTYAWNQDGAMISATSSTGEKYEYEYDALGNKTAVVHTDVDGAITRVEYLVDPTDYGDIVAEFDADGNVVATYSYGLGLANKADASGAAYYYATDMLGSTATITAENGAVVNEYAYAPFGATVYKSESVDNIFEFVGEYGVASEQNDSLISMRARWYDPATGRFVSEDPLGYGAGYSNLYSYCGNSIIVKSDATGMISIGSLSKLGQWAKTGLQWAKQKLPKRNVKAEEQAGQKVKSEEELKRLQQKVEKEKRKQAEVEEALKKQDSGSTGNDLDINGYAMTEALISMGILGIIGFMGGQTLITARQNASSSYTVDLIYDRMKAGQEVATFGKYLGTAGEILDMVNPFALGAGIFEIAEKVNGFIRDKTTNPTIRLTLSADNSGSMSDDIASVKNRSIAVVNALQDSGNYTVTVIQYCNYAKVLTDQSTNTSEIISKINEWNTHFGDGGTENTFTMLLDAMYDSNRQDSKAVIFMTDEPGDDRNLYSTVLEYAKQTNTTLHCVYSGSGSFSSAVLESEDELFSNAVASENLKTLCEESGGSFIYSRREDAAENILSIIASMYDYDGVYRGRNVYYNIVTEPIALDTSFSENNVKSVRWDFDNDGSIDIVSNSSVFDKTWTKSGAYRVRVEALMSDGSTKSDTLYVDVSDRFGEVVPTYNEDGSINDLYVYGWSGDDVITVKKGATEGTVSICLDPVTGKTTEYELSGKIVIKAYDGNNTITVDGALAEQVFVYGGAGEDSLIYDRSASVEDENYLLSEGTILVGNEQVVYDEIENVTVNAGVGTDAFEVQASEMVAYTINGATQSKVGDSLVIAAEAASEGAYVYNDATHTSGTWSNGAQKEIVFSGIESDAQKLAQKLDAPTVTKFISAKTITVEWNEVQNASGYELELATDDGFNQGYVSFYTTETSLKLDAPTDFSTYYCRVKALGRDQFIDSDWSQGVAAEVPEILNDPVWNLTDYPQYKSFKLDATTDSNYTATLYGLEKDGKTYTALQAWDFIGADATATLTGRNIVAENLWITEDAARLLGGVQFDGGELLLDTLRADGTAGNDAVAISKETVVVETPIYTTNPYEKCLERYKTLYGETSKTYLTIKANYDAAYARLSKLVTRKTSTYGVVDLNGTTLKFLGVRDVALNLGEGDDAVKVDALHYNYAINSTGGANSLDFSEATNALNLDLGATWRQFPLVGDGGTLQLSGVYTTVEGTAKNDRIVGTKAGLNFNGIAGSDSVTLVGGVNNVELNGARQSVTARGDGEYNVAIENGAGSVVNAGGVSKRGAVMVDAEGANTTIFGGLGVLNAGVRGRFAVVNAGATTRSTMFVEGANAVVTTGGGDDIVEVVGDYASVTTNGGADLVTITGADSNVHLGLGNDVLFLADGDSGRVGNHHVWADAGEDAVFAANTAGVNYFYAGAGNDVMIGGAGSDYMYANLGNNVLFGLGGVDRLFGGAGRDVLVASTTDATARLETMTQQELAALYAELYQAWEVDDDMDATVALLGEHCVADEAKDWIYRGGGRNNLVYASQLDADFENALENVPFNDELKLD